MRKSLVAIAVVLLSGSIGSGQDKRPIHVVIHAAPTQIKKAALAMFEPNGYRLDSDTSSQLKISKPFTGEETAAYNTAHWTSQPLANCRHVNTFSLSPTDDSVDVALERFMECRSDGFFRIARIGDEKQKDSVQGTLTVLKTKAEQKQ